MSKSVCALVHKPGSTREAFQAYYEEHHAPLGILHFPFTGYARNHLVDPGDFGWDTISEFWSADIARSAALMNGPVGEIMRADEVRFMNRSRIAPAGAEEVIVSGGERADAEGRRTAILLVADGGDEGARNAARQVAERVAGDASGVSIDFTTSWQEPRFPADAIVWLPGWPALDALDLGPGIRVLRARRTETPPEKLSGNQPSQGAAHPV